MKDRSPAPLLEGQFQLEGPELRGVELAADAGVGRLLGRGLRDIDAELNFAVVAAALLLFNERSFEVRVHANLIETFRFHAVILSEIVVTPRNASTTST